MASRSGRWFHYSGAIHIHTTDSDGTKPLDEVIRIGHRAGLDFMVFTDHMTLAGRERGEEGFHDGMLVMVGYEHNDIHDQNHYMILNSPRVYPEGMQAEDYVDAAREDGAFGIIAHPDEIRHRIGRYPPYPWTSWNTEAYDGFELWNQMSEWMEKLTPWNRLLKAWSPRKSITAPPRITLRRWDALNKKRRYVGIAGVDAHAFPAKVGPFTVEIFPYKVHFRSLRTHLLLDRPLSDDFAEARDQFIDALRMCRVFLSNMRWGEADRFLFTAQLGDRTVTCGESLPEAEGAVIEVVLPDEALIRLVHNGANVLQTYSDGLEYVVTKPGLYRVEAWKGRRGWIFSNHIRLGIDESA